MHDKGVKLLAAHIVNLGSVWPIVVALHILNFIYVMIFLGLWLEPIAESEETSRLASFGSLTQNGIKGPTSRKSEKIVLSLSCHSSSDDS